MCAINGINWADKAVVEKMNEATRHRGPDGTAVAVGRGVTLGHNRLAIIDLSDRSAQPMATTTGSLTITYNGELYNYKELKAEIGGRYPFQSEGDTEVILAAYALWGSECVKKFNGMFAFAIWDANAQSLFLARDHAGIKPLHYYFDGKKFIFSSEAKGIIAAGVPTKLNADALSMYFRLSYVPAPYTLFENIRSLHPGHTLMLSGTTLTEGQYWHLEDRPDRSLSLKAASERLNGLLDASVKRQLISDRPVGLFLSGGLDSSAVLSAASSVHPSIDTFTMRFMLPKGMEEEKFNADAELARVVSKHFGSRHHEITLSPEEVPSLLLKAAHALDVPVSNPTIPAMLKLSKMTAQTSTVVLNGDGGDELFGGYTRYRYSKRIIGYQNAVPLPLRYLLGMHPTLRKVIKRPGVDLFAQFMFQKDAVLAGVLSGQLITQSARNLFAERHFAPSDREFVRRFMDADREGWLPDEALMRTDRTTMAASLEGRVPFLDKGIMEFAATVPTKLKVDMRKTKILPRHAFSHRLPREIIGQKKRGWVSPGAKWLRDPKVLAFVTEALSSNYAPLTSELFDFQAVRQVLDGHVSGKKYNLYLLWSILTFQLWAREWGVTL